MGHLQKFMRGQVWWQKNQQKPLTPGVQSEGRPVLIVSNNSANKFSCAVTVIPFTTAAKKDLPTHVRILMDNEKTISTALAEQIRTIPSDTLTNYIGTIDENKMTEIEGAMLKALGFTPVQNIELESSKETLTECESYLETPTITLNADPINKDTNTPTDEEKVTDTNVGDTTPKLRAKKFSKQEKKMIEGYLQHHTITDTANYFAKIYNVDFKKMYSRVCNLRHRAKQK